MYHIVEDIKVEINQPLGDRKKMQAQNYLEQMKTQI
jgi:hypothetical protein